MKSGHDVSIFFHPQGVAVIGASRDPQKLGFSVVQNLIEHHYSGPIYPINRRAPDVLGVKAYPSILDAPDPLDLAVLIVPASVVAEELENCGQRGIKAAIIASGGFREAGVEGAEREEQVKEIAARYGMLVLGPNCIGTMDTHTPINTTFVTGMPRPGEIAFVSQSGAMAAALIDWARGSGVGFSRITSLGNSAVISEADMLAASAADGWTKVIASYMEGVSDGRRYIDAASSITPTVPIIVLKVGRGSGAAKAVASHTGALAGDEAAYDAAFRRAGVLRAPTLEAMLDWARALAWQPLPRGNRVAILTNAGGPGVLALDALEEAGMKLAPLTKETKAYLRQRVFEAASVENPVDILAGSGPATYAICLDALLADPTVDAVVVVQAPQDWFAPVSLAEVVGEVASSPLARKKPILGAIMGLASTSEATQALHRRKVPNYAFPERLGSTLGAMWQRKRWLDIQALGEEPVLHLPGCMPDRAVEAISMKGSDGWLPPEAIDILLGAYCISVPGSGLADSPDEAVRLAGIMGYPVVLKLAAEGLTHKTDIGGVIVGLKNDLEVRSAFTDLMDHAAASLNPTQIKGVLVQQMVCGGRELIVGAVRDPQFGPLVMAGTGGTQVELVHDVAFDLAPLSHSAASTLFDQTAAGKLLAGFRGTEPADREAAVDVLLRLASVMVEHPEIAEIEINPLLVLSHGEGAFAVDTRVRIGS